MKRILPVLLLLSVCACQEYVEYETAVIRDYYEENTSFLDRTIYDTFSQTEYESTLDAFNAAQALCNRYLSNGDLNAPGYVVASSGSGDELTLTTPMGTHRIYNDNHITVSKGGKEVLSGDIHVSYDGKSKSFNMKDDGKATVDGVLYFGPQRAVLQESTLECRKQLISTDFDLKLNGDLYAGDVLLCNGVLTGSGDITVKIPLPDVCNLRVSIPGKLMCQAKVSDLLNNKHEIGLYYNGRAEKRADLHFTNLRRFVVVNVFPPLAKWLGDDEKEQSAGAITFRDENFLIKHTFEDSFTPEVFPLTSALIEGRSVSEGGED